MMKSRFAQYLLDDENIKIKKKDEADCSNCGMLKKNMIIDINKSNLICDCGYTYKQFYSESETSDQKNIHYSNYINPYFKNVHIGTVISSQKKTIEMKNIMNIHNQNIIPVYFERRLYQKIMAFKKKCLEKYIDNYIVETGVEYLVKISKLKYLDGKNVGRHLIFRKNISRIYAGCLFRAFKNNGKCKTDQFIASVFCIQKSDVSKGIKMFNKIILKYDVEIQNLNIHPNNYIDHYCEELGLSDFFKEPLKIVVGNILKYNILNNKKYMSLIEGCLMLITFRLNIDIDEVIYKYDDKKNEKSINKTFYQLYTFNDIIMPTCEQMSEIINKYNGTYIFEVNSENKII